MFTVTAKGIYGLTALLDLCEQYGRGPRQIKDIAQKYEIPQHYLEQILVTLKKAGLVESFRGASGGYALAQHPARITLLDALQHLEGKLELLSDQRRGNPLDFFWADLEDRIRRNLSRSLEYLLEAYQHQRSQISYEI